MGYAEYIKTMLEPLRLYDFSGGTVVSAETDAAGYGLDELAALFNGVEIDSIPLSASDAALSLWEQILPHNRPSSMDARRLALVSLLSTTDRSFTPAALAKSLAACGLRVEVRELGAGCIEVSFPDVAGVPADFDRITATLDTLLPCHLLTEYHFNYITWELFEKYFTTWTAFEAAGTWEAIELKWK